MSFIANKFVQQIFVQFSVKKSFILSVQRFNNMSPSFLHQIIAACPNPKSVKIRDETTVADKIQVIVSQGPQSLQVITDFDATLTRYHLNGEKCDSSYGIIASSPIVPEDYRKKAMDLYNKYSPIEVSPRMTIEEKTPHMIDWYKYSHEFMVQTRPRMNKANIQEMVAISSSHLRDNAKEAVERMSKVGVPLLILSAGVGDIVEAVVQGAGINFPNVKIISNFMDFDDGDEIIGFKDPLIHMYNKNEAAMHDDNSQYFQDLGSRRNVILLGDSLGDANMDHGVQNEDKTVLKIGFLNAHFERHLDAFMTAFDIVLVDDQSFDFLNLLLDHVFKPSNAM